VQLRITVEASGPGSLVRVDGWLDGGGVAELLRVLDATPAPVRLVRRDLRGADAAGVDALRGLEQCGVALDGLSPYIRLMLSDPAGRVTWEAPRRGRSETLVKRREDA
jgi:hypothetical protein